MGIRKRVEDAELLWREGQAEGSLSMALIAAVGELSARAGGAPSYELRLSEAWLHHVLDVVIYDPVNQGLFPEGWRDDAKPC